MARKGTMTMLSSLVPNAQSLRSLGASGSQDILVNRRMTQVGAANKDFELSGQSVDQPSDGTGENVDDSIQPPPNPQSDPKTNSGADSGS